MEKTLTVFTPTYNRAYRLNQCYESLVRQTSKDFLWLIIDDGSTDDTYDRVKRWIGNDNGFEIIYTYKENGGVHTACNWAYKLITTELNICLDSDDYMTDDAVESLIRQWKDKKSEQYAGIIALDQYQNGETVGSTLPAQEAIHLLEFYDNGGKGDKKLIYRTEVVKRYPEYPVFEGEKFVPSGYKYMLIDQDFTLLILNKPICVVEYLEDGYSRNINQMFRNNPKGFAFLKNTQMRYDKKLIRKFITCIQYVAFMLLSKNIHIFKETSYKFMTFCAIPLGFAFHCYIRIKTMK